MVGVTANANKVQSSFCEVLVVLESFTLQIGPSGINHGVR